MWLFLLIQLPIATSLSGKVLDTSNNTRQVHSNNQFVFYNSDFTYRIINAKDNTYGYEILIDGKVAIRQLSIPSKEGTHGFKTKTDAEKVAQLVLKKIRLGIMPPSIDKIDLHKLKINY